MDIEKKGLYRCVVLVVVLFLCSAFYKKELKKRPIQQLYTHAEQLKYPSMPQYFIEGQQSGCFYEIYVNGILRFKHYKNVGLANHAVNINDLILKSGTQTVTVKLFPLGKIGEENYLTLDDDTRFELEIFKRDKTTPWEGLDYDVVKTYFAPTVTGEDTGAFKYAGAPMYEETFTFEAEVPYELKGWSESEVLSDMDQDSLEKEILAFYKMYGDIIYNQDEEKWARLVKNREKEYFLSVYYNDKKSEKLKRRINDFILPFDSNFKERFPLSKYEIIFGGKGKVVTLKSIEKKGKSAFSYAIEEIKNGKSYKYKEYRYLFLHKPKGSTKLEIIR